ncbi:MAG: TonB-dependent receptor [Rikenellaceae bacterium]|nr:TonB-dependent receptor [Rikenellaceae bacterium]MCL2692171.1 TonB-dependent receptor [Rikenellaceae bacterium]
MKNHIFAAILLFAAAVTAVRGNNHQPTDANFTGHVLNRQTQEHIPHATITVRGTNIGTVTDRSGHYRLNNVPVGAITIVASLMGFETQEIEVKAQSGHTIEVNFELTEQSVALDRIVVSASRSAVSQRDAVSIVNVVTPAVFEITNSVALADGLNFQPGLRVEQNCQNCGFPQLRINGLEGPYTQILIDSRPINSALAGVYALEQIPVNMIERVEVVRGGASALFGSSAIGGTVNIITREPTHNSLTVSNISSLIYGRAPDIATNLNASVVSDDRSTGVSLFASSRTRAALDYNGDGFSEIGEINMTNIGFRGFYRPAATSRLTLEYHTIDEFRRGGDRLDRPPHEAEIAEQTEHAIHSGGAKYDIFFDGGKHHLQFFSALQHIDRRSYYGAGQDPDAYGRTDDMSFVTGGQYTLRMDRLAFMPATLVGGVEYSHNALRDEMLGYGRIIDQTVDIYSVFAQNEWRGQLASILLGGRLDKHSMMRRPILVPRISGRLAPASWLSLRTGYAAGYRGPQAYDEDLHVTAVGGGVALIRVAPDLEPERSHTITLSAELMRRRPDTAFQLLAEGFYTRLDHVFVIEEVDTDADGNLILERRNGEGAVVAGVNLEANYIASRALHINAGFTLQSSRYTEPEQWSETVEPGRRMFRAPNDYGYLTTVWSPVRPLDLSLSGIYTGSMLVQHFAGYIEHDREVTTPAFFDLNLRAAYAFRLRGGVELQVSMGVQNVFNSFQRDFDRGPDRDSGYIYGPALPRTASIGVRLTM